MVYPQQAIPYLPPLVAFYDMQENKAVQFYSPRNRRGGLVNRIDLDPPEKLITEFVNGKCDTATEWLIYDSILNIFFLQML